MKMLNSNVIINIILVVVCLSQMCSCIIILTAVRPSLLQILTSALYSNSLPIHFFCLGKQKTTWGKMLMGLNIDASFASNTHKGLRDKDLKDKCDLLCFQQVAVLHRVYKTLRLPISCSQMQRCAAGDILIVWIRSTP